MTEGDHAFAGLALPTSVTGAVYGPREFKGGKLLPDPIGTQKEVGVPQTGRLSDRLEKVEDVPVSYEIFDARLQFSTPRVETSLSSVILGATEVLTSSTLAASRPSRNLTRSPTAKPEPSLNLI